MATILRLPAVIEMCGISRSQIYNMMTRGEFPRPVQLSLRAVGWTRESIDAWVEARAQQPLERSDT